jgi:N-acetylneuraminic acid mutarotase
MDNTWVTAASAPVFLDGQTATLLGDGTVLVDGGDPTQTPPGAAVYDPVANAWTPTGPTATSRYNTTATLLKDGRVLVVGGAVLNQAPGQLNQVILLSSAELYDPKVKTWSLAAPLPAPREAHAAVLLEDGRVLVVGGDNNAPPPLDALLYDPSNDTWTSTTPPLPIGDNPTATLLKSGKILVTYYFGGGTSAIFDPTSNSWETGPNTNSPHMFGATATLLNDGRVLLVGGLTGQPPAASTSPPELYDPTANSWSMAGTMNTNRVAHIAALLPNGKVLAAGGRDGNEDTVSTAELYDPNTNTWSPAASMATPRANGGAVLLPLGQVFAIGGNDNGAALLSSELYW